MAQISAFEILGPIMVGPSSSHTAGALRCAQVAASLLEDPIARVRFILHNSFAHTYRGHGTDRALVAGILGLATDDERIRSAFDLAREQGLEWEFVRAADDPGIHPNTVDIQMVSESGARAEVRAESLGGGRVRVSRINGVEVAISGEYETVFVAHRDARGVLARLTVMLSEAKINIAFMRTYRTERGGDAYTVFELDDAPENEGFPELLARIRKDEHVRTATLIRLPGAKPVQHGAGGAFDFQTADELKSLCDGFSIGQVMRRREYALTGAEETDRQIRRTLEVMREETTAPLSDPRPSLGGLIGGEAKLVHDATGLAAHLMGEVQTDAVARAMAVLERSASMGVIVAAPTAGSAGVVPGCVLALAERLGASERDVEDALFCAAAVGLSLTVRACVAGAEGGCQAEVGSAAAMAAAALVQLLGGTPEQSLDAASIALANLLGLVCDPVGGLVEVPCQNRNAIGAAAAFSSAQLALSGVRAFVPFDQMAKVMLEVGHALPAALRETAQGGCATSPAALAACVGCNACA